MRSSDVHGNPGRTARPAVLLHALRPHQWVKNLLLFVPVLLAHKLPWDGPAEAERWLRLAGGFAAFCLAASSVYVLNDLRDVAADREHPTKRRRPFAAGTLPTSLGPLLIVALLAAATGICLLLPWRFAGYLGVYVALSTSYSLWLKRRMLVDVFLLAGLYTLRLEAGGRVAEVVTSHWLVAFSIFLFVSLAFAKRYAELATLADQGRTSAEGRNYTVDDLRVIESTGPASGYMAVLVLALYINDAVQGAARLYAVPRFLWLLCPLLMYWITRIWFFARRRALDEDPILFAIRDRVSWAVAATAVALVVLAWQPWGRW
jgi:4-hydroxybenzoate polyprenyltransferase